MRENQANSFICQDTDTASPTMCYFTHLVEYKKHFFQVIQVIY